jgi:flavin reductase (DIM6/NTAB) family NADH-FMN oxidoreductase RutF
MVRRSRKRTRRSSPLARVCRLLVPGPVVLLTTANRGRMNVMTMSWHAMPEFELPLIAECHANLECHVVDTRLVTKYNFFVLEVRKAWFAPRVRAPRTIHHRGRGEFMVAGRTIRLKSRMM